jgi:MFS family permease
MFVYSIAAALMLFAYPLILKDQNNNSTFLVYFMMFGQQLLQMIAINHSGKIPPLGKTVMFLVGLFGTMILSFILLLTSNLIIVTIGMILFGLLGGYIYAYGSQCMLELCKTTGNSKYSVIYETFSGLGSGIMPLIAGIIAMVNYHYNFTLQFFVYLVFIMLVIILNKAFFSKLKNQT